MKRIQNFEEIEVMPEDYEVINCPKCSEGYKRPNQNHFVMCGKIDRKEERKMIKQKLINLLSIPIIIYYGCLALAETNAIILRHKKKWDFIDKITFFQSPMVMYYYANPCLNEKEIKEIIKNEKTN